MIEQFVEGFWPFWLGAFGLSFTAFGFCFFMKTPLGVSGFFRRVLFFRANLQKERMQAAMKANQASVQEALQQATAAHMAELSEDDRKLLEAHKKVPKTKRSGKAVVVSLSASAIYLLFIVVGGFVGQFLNGSWTVAYQPSGSFNDLVAGPELFIPALILGGVLVGFGTSMSGGCTSGHGLSGTARLQPGSLVSTASFFGTAIVVAFILRSLL
ncbi:MAG: YeeE/YedE thiosulfate transporter family protein [Planctomycetota bacterium]|nr:YeeE/YedE thiosulfate transporter family protein [Planctomycetota bacterium]